MATDRSVRKPALSGWAVASLLIAGLIALPVGVVLSQVGADTSGVWAHLAETVLSAYIVNTLVLAVGVGAVALSIGVTTAWLVTMTRFPGRQILEWTLLLPLAVPAYVLAYVYTDLLEFSGPVQAMIRDVTGWGYGDYWFPRIRSLPGAIMMLGLVLYPYVYLLARAAFLEQCPCLLEVSRTLGRGPWRSFFTVALPLARPSLVGGLALVLMETIADYGTVEYFGVRTFTTGIYRTWFGLGSPAAAAQLASAMLLMVTALIFLERWSRGQARYFHTTSRYTHLRPKPLRGGKALLALVASSIPLVLGFAVPALYLLYLAITRGDPLWGGRFVPYAANSLILASVTAAVAVALALFLAYSARLDGSPLIRTTTRFAAMGYAVPGSVIAVGVLIPFAAFDNAVDHFMREAFGVSTGLLLTGTIVALVFAYLVRFLAISLNTVEASLGKIKPSMDQAARCLGHGPGDTLLRVHTPMMRGGILTAALLVFVDVMKELPATLIVRPFNFDTLAVRVYRLAADERLAEASTAALVIVAVGILPVIVLSRAIGRSRPGHGR